MMADLNDSEMKVATKLIFDGLSMAKSSMEQILQSPINIEQIDYVNADLDLIDLAAPIRTYTLSRQS